MSIGHRSLSAWALCLLACNSTAPTATSDPAKGTQPTANASAKGPAKTAKTSPAKNHFGSSFKVKSGVPLAQAIARSEKAAVQAAKAAPAKPTAEAAGESGSCAEKAAKEAKPAVAANEEASTCAGLTKPEGEVVRVRGKVDSVCQKAGCWMVLKDGEAKVRIFTKGHGFFLPRDIAGRTAEVEGTLRPKTLSKSFAKHLAEDKGADPAKVTGPRREYILTASAVALR